MKAADLRKAILQYAVEGKLVPQDNQDEPASILYEKIIVEKENLIKQGKIKKEKPLPPITDDDIPYNIPENWKWVRLGEVCDKITDGAHQTPTYISNGIPFLSVKNISNGFICFDDVKYISQAEHEILYSRCNIEKDDILLTKVGTTGIPVIVDTDKIFDIFVSIALLKINTKYLNNKFLKYTILSPMIQELVKLYTRGIGNKNLVIKDIKNFHIPLPPLKEQERIVKKVDELMALCDKLEQEEEKLLALDENFMENLPKSILQYAVEGKLVNQDIHDEPASILYEKIIAEKENLIKQGKIKKEKTLPPITDDEIPYDIPNNWKWVRLEHITYLIGNKNNIILAKQVKETGKYPVVSQSKNLIDGFYDDESKLIKINTPVVIFGDHTKNVKYIDFDFIVGADGTQILKPIIIDSKFLYYIILHQTFIMKNRGYARHFSLLKKAILPLPPLKEQEKIVKKVDELLTYCNKLKDIV